MTEKRKMPILCGTPIIQMKELIRQKKIEDETFRTLNQFEKIIKKKDTLQNLLSKRRMYREKLYGYFGYYRDINQVINNKDKDLINLISNYQQHKCYFCYVKFVSDVTKPGLNLVDRNENDSYEMITVPIDFKYGIIVYYVENNTLHRFMFAPVIETDYDCELYLKAFYIIDEHRQYNYIKINKPLIKKEMKRNSSLKLLISLPGGGYCSIPENKLRKSTAKIQGLINKFNVSHEEANKLAYYEDRKCPKCKKEKTVIKKGRSGRLFVACNNFPICKYVKRLNIWSQKDE